MTRRRKLAFALLFAIGVAGLAIALVEVIEFRAHREHVQRERLTPNLDLFRRGDGDVICYEVGIIDLDEATTLWWEQVRVKEYTAEGPSWSTPGGVDGTVEIGDRFCGYKRYGYYDIVYTPTGLPMFFSYPACGGNPEALYASDPCNPPREWPRE